MVNGKVTEFNDIPVQRVFPRHFVLSLANSHALDIAMMKLSNQKMVESSEPLVDQGLFSNFFSYFKEGR